MTYPGGKNGAGVYQTIINQMPPHDLYIEPFLGSGAVLRMKRAAIGSIGIDSDDRVVRSFLANNDVEVLLPAPLAVSGDRISSGLTVIHGDGIRWLQDRRHWTGRELVYCDPPYLMTTRLQHRRIYRCELEELRHVELLGTLKALPCLVMISGYDSPLYRSMLERWRVVSFETVTRGGTKATEFLWMNYPEPQALHDYRFIGTDFRERERIKRRALRWKSRLLSMTPAERKAVSAVLAEFC